MLVRCGASRRLVQRRLLHDAEELLLVNLAVAVAVRLVDHLLQVGGARFGIVPRHAPWAAGVDRACSSSSVIFSPNSLATRFRFLKEILPVSSSSKSRKAFRISSLESFSLCERAKGSARGCRQQCEYFAAPRRHRIRSQAHTEPARSHHPVGAIQWGGEWEGCLLYTSPSPRDLSTSRMPSSA